MLYTSKAVGEWLGITDRQVRNLRDQGVLSEVRPGVRSEEHTSELQSRGHLVCRLLLEKKKTKSKKKKKEVIK